MYRRGRYVQARLLSANIIMARPNRQSNLTLRLNPTTSAVTNSSPLTGLSIVCIIASNAGATAPVGRIIVSRCVSSESCICDAMPLGSAAWLASTSILLDPRSLDVLGPENCGSALWAMCVTGLVLPRTVQLV
jgi:hypothetical protein